MLLGKDQLAKVPRKWPEETEYSTRPIDEGGHNYSGFVCSVATPKERLFEKITKRRSSRPCQDRVISISPNAWGISQAETPSSELCTSRL